MSVTAKSYTHNYAVLTKNAELNRRVFWRRLSVSNCRNTMNIDKWLVRSIEERTFTESSAQSQTWTHSLEVNEKSVQIGAKNAKFCSFA